MYYDEILYCMELQILRHLVGEHYTVQDVGSVCNLVISDVERQKTVVDTLIKQCMVLRNVTS